MSTEIINQYMPFGEAMEFRIPSVETKKYM